MKNYPWKKCPFTYKVNYKYVQIIKIKDKKREKFLSIFVDFYIWMHLNWCAFIYLIVHLSIQEFFFIYVDSGTPVSFIGIAWSIEHRLVNEFLTTNDIFLINLYYEE